MGQKVNPLGIRLGITRDWTSKWYASKKQFPLLVHTDFLVREFLKKKLTDASVSRVLIERAAKKVNITIQTARPGIVIGKKGEDIEKLRGETAKLLGMAVSDVRLNISEIRKPELDAQLVAESISQQIEKRVMFRRAMKRAVMSTMRSGALGIKVRMSGRLNGSEIARTEWYREGRVPLHTFRADIDYGLAEARTTYGVIGIKVWIFKGEVFDQAQIDRAAPRARPRRGRSRPMRQLLPLQPRAHRSAAGAAGSRSGAAGGGRSRKDSNEVMLQPKRTKYRKQFKEGRNAEARRCAAVPVPSATSVLKATDRARA